MSNPTRKAILLHTMQILASLDPTVSLIEEPDRGLAMATALQIIMAEHQFSLSDQQAVLESLLVGVQYNLEVGTPAMDQQELITRMTNALRMSGACHRRVM